MTNIIEKILVATERERILERQGLPSMILIFKILFHS